MPSLVYPVFRLLTTLSAKIMMPATSAAGLRRLREQMTSGGDWIPLARGVTSQPNREGGITGEWVTPKGANPSAVLLYLHGGGWALGLDTVHRSMISHLARAAGLRTLSLDYRLAPEHPFPAALDDCLAAFAWLQTQGVPANRIVVAGDSAGANLALALVHARRQRGLPLPAAVASLSGAFDLTCSGDSFHAIADVQLSQGFVRAVVGHYAPGLDLRDPLLSPLWGDLEGFPPLLLQAGACELLLSDSTRLAERAEAAGVRATLSVYPHMWHAWQVWTPLLPEATTALREVGMFLKNATA